MNKSSLLMQQEEIRNKQVYDPSQTLKLIADIVSPITKSMTKSTGVIKKSLGSDDKKSKSNRNFNSRYTRTYTTKDFTPSRNAAYPAGYKTGWKGK